MIAKQIAEECFVSVVIPVKNEAEFLESTLFSLAGQFDLNDHPLGRDFFEIIVLINNCADDSAIVAKAWQAANPATTLHIAEINLPPEKSNVGYVRRRLMEEAYRRLCQNKYRKGVIMTTDGDTSVAPDWIASNLKELELGADAVGGRILFRKKDLREMNKAARRFHLFDTGYRLAAAALEARMDFAAHDPGPRHHQHFNGSFAVTTDAYRRSGGVPEVKFLEDVAFYHALLRVDARVRHSPRVRVYTSPRISGRTALGLSTQINEWQMMGEAGAVYFVESAQSIAERAFLRTKLYELWRTQTAGSDKIREIAQRLLIPPSALESELQNSATFGILMEKVHALQNAEGAWREKYPLVCVTRALADLRRTLALLKSENHAPPAAFSQTSSR